MSALRLALHEARSELRAGLRSGVVGLVFVGLAAYLLMSLTNADYVQKMGAADIPRNAPSLVYLMSTGCMFFLFFAWAWVFAQPLLRDRQASLHEVMLSMPASLPAILWGRFIGASLVGGLLGASLIAGFIATPLLDWLSLVPHGSVSSPPWVALAFAWSWLLFPVGVGIGALYYIATLKLRSVAGAFALSALLMLLWMFAVVVLKGGHISPMLAAALDPSLFTYALGKVEAWTPLQKRTSLLPLTGEFLFNRFIWCVLPVLLLAFVLRGVRREAMALERPPRRRKPRASHVGAVIEPVQPPPVESDGVSWISALLSETRWQLFHVVRGKALWIGVAILLAMGVLGGFIHGVWHAEGPMRPRPELLLPLLNSTLFLVIAFVVAALAGMVWRRDHVDGFDAMLDAAPAPSWLRPFGRVLAVSGIIVGLALVPGIAGMLITALGAPSALDPLTALLYQLLVTAPALLELGLLVVLVHALFSRAAVAYPVSMLLTFFLVLNHELGLVDYPLYEVGIPAHLHLSGATGWVPWTGYVSALGGYKLGLCLLLAAFSAVLVKRGAEGRLSAGWRDVGRRLAAPVIAVVVLGAGLMTGLGIRLHAQLVTLGDYQPRTARDHEDAEWERRWLHSAGAYSVRGGHVSIYVNSASGTLHGDWVIHGVHAEHGELDAELPPDLMAVSATVDGRTVLPVIAADHLRLPLGDASSTHMVRLRWDMHAPGWSAEGVPAWRGHGSLWLQATAAMPRLGVDPSRLLRSPVARAEQGLAADVVLPAAGASVASDAAAPAGAWQWTVRRDDLLVASATTGPDTPLAFAAAWSPSASHLRSGETLALHDASRDGEAADVIADVSAMRACVSRRLGIDAQVDAVVQWPRGLAATRLDGTTLVLPEAPDWDVADKGTGRTLRKAHIAAALARRALVDASALRDSAGSAWWSDAVPGAIALLCVGDTDGVTAMRQTMELGAERVSRALAASSSPVGPLAQAEPGGWASAYGPLAALAWTSARSTADFTDANRRIASGESVQQAMAASMSDEERSAAFGPPRATEWAASPDRHITVERWTWRDGGWVPLAAVDPGVLWLVRRGESMAVQRVPDGVMPDEDGVPVDALPSYPRSPLRTISSSR